MPFWWRVWAASMRVALSGCDYRTDCHRGCHGCHYRACHRDVTTRHHGPWRTADRATGGDGRSGTRGLAVPLSDGHVPTEPGPVTTAPSVIPPVSHETGRLPRLRRPERGRYGAADRPSIGWSRDSDRFTRGGSESTTLHGLTVRSYTERKTVQQGEGSLSGGFKSYAVAERS